MSRAPFNLSKSFRYGDTLNFEVAGGDPGLEQKIAALRAIIHSTDDTQDVHQVARQLAAQSPRKNRLAQAKIVYDLLSDRSRVTYKDDTRAAENFVHPDQLLAELAAGQKIAIDCDDVAVLGASLIRAMGHEAWLIVSRATPNVGPWAHIFYGLSHRGYVVPCDPQERHPMGTVSPRAGEVRCFRVDLKPTG